MRSKSKPFSRQGLHRLECECGSYLYATVAQLERVGLPRCGCGAQLVPGRVELAMLLGVECDATAEYEREINRVSHGQAGPGRALRAQGRQLRDPSLIAAERVERRRVDRARANRLGALLPAADPLPF